MSNAIDSYQNETRVFAPSKDFAANSLLNSNEEYEKLYAASMADPEKFWSQLASKELMWTKPWDKVLEHDFSDEIDNSPRAIEIV